MDKREEEIKFPKDWHRAGMDPIWLFDRETGTNDKHSDKILQEISSKPRLSGIDRRKRR